MVDYSVLFSSGQTPYNIPNPTFRPSPALTTKSSQFEKDKQAQLQKSYELQQKLFVEGKTPIKPSLNSSTTFIKKKDLVGPVKPKSLELDFVGAPKPSNITSSRKSIRDIIKPTKFKSRGIFLPSSEFVGGVKSEVKTKLKQYGQAFKTASKVTTKEGFKDYMAGGKVAYDFLKKGVIELGTLKGTRDIVKNKESILDYKQNKLPAIKQKVKFGAITIGTSAADYGTSFFKNPATRGKALVNIGELFLWSGGAKKLAQVGDRAIRRTIIKTGATYVPKTEVFSKQALTKAGELKEGTALVRTTSVKDSFSKLGKTKGVYPEYPKHFVLQSSEQSAMGSKAYRILSQSEKKTLGLKIRNEDPGKWFGTKGEGAAWPLRISNNQTSYNYSLSPMTITKSTKPGIVETLVKRGERYPLAVLKKDVGFKTISDYLKVKARTKPSTALFPKRSEVSAIGDAKINKIIRKVDPKIHGSSELQYILGPDVIIAPAKKLQPKTFIGKLKGYEHYTEAFGELVPIRKGIVSGASVYQKGKVGFSGLKPLAVSEKGFINLTKSNKSISKDLTKFADRQIQKISERSFFKSVEAGKSKSALSQAYSLSVAKKIFTVNPPYQALSGFIKPSKYGILSSGYKLKPTSEKYSIFYKPNYKYKPSSSYTASNTYKPTDSTVYKPSYKITSNTYKKDFLPKYDTRYTTTYETRYEPTYYTPGKSKYTYTPVYPKLTLPKTPTKDKIVGSTDRTDYYKKYNDKQAFDVFVRSKKIWTKVDTPQTLNYFAAKSKGLSVADNYAERSVRLKATNKKAQVISRSEPQNLFKFNYNKSKTKDLALSFIEKSKYAIDSTGELKGITYKGIKANKNKKKKGLFKY